MKKNINYVLIILITVACGQNDGTAPGEDTASGCNGCRIFVSASTANGASGLSGFDSLCNNDSNKPSGVSTYKALLVSNTRNNNTADWPLRKSTAYYRPSGELITSTDQGGVFSLPLQNTFSTTNYQVRTGLLPDMGINNTCVNWTSINGIETASYGETQYTDDRSYVYLSNLCSTPARVYCVEQ